MRKHQLKNTSESFIQGFEFGDDSEEEESLSKQMPGWEGVNSMSEFYESAGEFQHFFTF